jgi:hypothetical protein
MVYEVSAIVRLPSEISPGVIEVERLPSRSQYLPWPGIGMARAPINVKSVFKRLRIWRPAIAADVDS